MKPSNVLLPSLNDGRLFISPILGCNGACGYCYLCIHDYKTPQKNQLTEEDIFRETKSQRGFVFGKNGTIVSIGAWGDIFPKGYDDLARHSIDLIKAALAWGNPVQIMSKNSLKNEYIEEIISAIRYPRQLLYSTAITSIQHWRTIEPLTSSPTERLETCACFHSRGVPTNVLLKPFFPTITGAEIEQISDMLLAYNVDFCTTGIVYWDAKIAERMSRNPVLKKLINYEADEFKHLDCNGYEQLNATSIKELLPFVDYLNKKGIRTFLKSSCINANLLGLRNQSNYYEEHNSYCINCGNCAQKTNPKNIDGVFHIRREVNGI